MAETSVMKIDAQSRNVRDLLENKKYYIDDYQREYRWQNKHIEDLLSDLLDKFEQNYDKDHTRDDGGKYAHYFLGSIILSQKNGHRYIVDGQQRLTSLTLLLIYLKNLQKSQKIANSISLESCIFSDIRGQKSFNLQVPDRTSVMEALYNNQGFDPSNQSESVQNIYARYDDIESLFPSDYDHHVILMFTDWLLYNVDLVEIVAYSDEEAYTVFETMNDRGLSLSPTDMLKGYLLSNIDEERRSEANRIWKSRILELVEFSQANGLKNEDIEACKSWFRAKYANSIRERKRGATNQDFEQIGTEFHRWIRSEKSPVILHSPDNYYRFIQQNFEKYTGYYLKMQQMAHTFDPNFEYVYYNAHNNFTLQYILALASIRLEDNLDIAERKIRMVTGFLDIFIARRMVNFRTLSYSSIVYTMFNLMKKIRDLDLDDLANVLQTEAFSMTETFDGIHDFYLHGQNKKHIHYLLARITAYIEGESGIGSNFTRYINKSKERRAKRYEVEHIWANKFDQHEDEFHSSSEFEAYRNHFGGLLLLPRGTNQSYNALPYSEKLSHYLKQNALAQSLHEQAYQRNPNFTNFVAQSSLPFQPHPQFNKADLDERQELYRQICERIWDPARLERELV